MRRHATHLVGQDFDLHRDARRFHDLNQSGLLPLAYFDLTGTILDTNEAFANLLSYDHDELQRSPLTLQRTVVAEYVAAIETALADLRRDGRCGPREIQFSGRNGSTFWGLFQAAILENEDVAFALIQDVTIPKEIEQDLQETTAMLERAQRIGRMGYWVYQVATQQLTWSTQAAMIAVAENEAVNSNVLAAFLPSDRRKLLDKIDESIRKRSALRMNAFVQRAKGEQRIVYLEADIDLDHQGAPSRLVGFIQDVTEEMREHEALVEVRAALETRVLQRTRELADANLALHTEIADRQRSELARLELLRRVVTVQEDERRRIARELHDQMGQLLVALMLGMKSLEDAEGLDETIRQRIQKLRGMANDVGHEIHELALELRPTALDDLGLVSALCQYIESWSARSKIEADIHISGLDEDRLPLILELTLYRITQEALNNVLKHAQAERVSIVIERRADQLTMIVEDNGVGFKADEPAKSPNTQKHLGLLGITERLATLGGTLEVESDLHEGTALYIRVPLPIGVDRS